MRGSRSPCATDPMKPLFMYTNDIKVLYHFTCYILGAIRGHNLLSVSCLSRQSLRAVLNSDERSLCRNFVRLSLNKENRMEYIASRKTPNLSACCATESSS